MKYTIEQKQEVLEFFNNYGYSETAKKYRATIYPETIRRWTKPELQIYYKNKHRENYLTRKYNNVAENNISQIQFIPTAKEIDRDMRVLIRTIPSYQSPAHLNNIVLKHQPHFFDRQYKLWQNKDIRLRIIKNREKNLNKPADQMSSKELLRGFGLMGICKSYSYFSPFWLSKFIEQFNATTVYDPCGGWGHRLLGVS